MHQIYSKMTLQSPGITVGAEADGVAEAAANRLPKMTTAGHTNRTETIATMKRRMMIEVVSKVRCVCLHQKLSCA